MGCLPVVVSDGVLQPFEPEMDWAAFALRVAHPDVPGMHQVRVCVCVCLGDGRQGGLCARMGGGKGGVCARMGEARTAYR